MISSETTAAVVLLCAGIIHNYSFMCRKLPMHRRPELYPTSAVGSFLFNLSWMSLAGFGFVLCSKLSSLLFWVAVGVYFLLFPFLLQPQLARLLGFNSLTEYVACSDEQNQNRE